MGKLSGIRVLAWCLLTFVSTVTPCGITTHLDIGYRAAAFFNAVSKSGANYAELVLKHQDAFQASTSFPDAFYPGICSGGKYHAVSEDTHWTPYLEAAVKYIRDTYPQPWDERAEKLVVFLLGIIQHQVSDVTWHNLKGIREGYLDVMGKVNFHGNFEDAHSHGDFGGDVINMVELNTDYMKKLGTWYLPLEDLAGIYRVLYNGQERIPNDVISKCTKLMFLGRLGEKLGAINLAYPWYAMKGPFLLDRLQDYFLGGMDDMAAWTGHVWSHTAHMLDQGTEVCDLPENPVYIKCSGSHGYDLAGNASHLSGAHDRTGWHHPDTLSRMIGDLSISDVEVEERDGAIVIAASDKLQNLYSNAITHAASVDQFEASSDVATEGDSVRDKIRKLLEFLKGRREDGVVPTIPKTSVRPDATEDVFSRLGESMLSADLNGDGFDDLVVGAPVYGKPGNAMAGRVYIMYGTADGLGSEDITISKDADVILEAVMPNGRFGTALAAVDMNADGILDLAVSAPMEGSQQLEYKGAVYIFYGKEDGTLNTDHDMRISCTKSHCNMGWSLAGSDVDGDGFRDIVIGCPFASAGGSQRGMVGIIHGKHSLKYVDALTDAEFEWEWFGGQDWAWLGYSVAAAGDWVAIGSPQQRICANSGCSFSKDDKQSAGQVLLFERPLGRTPTATLKGTDAFGQFGHHVAFSDDGRTLAVGAISENQGGLVLGKFQEGRVYLYNSGDKSFRRAAATLKGVKMLSRFGQHVKIVDVNGDNIDDVIASAPLFNGNFWGQAQEGRVYIFYGKDANKAASGITSGKADGADVVLTLAEGRSRFGTAVAPLKTTDKTRLAIASIHSDEGARLGGKVSIFDI